MKRFICCILMIVMILSITACDLGNTVGKVINNLGDATQKSETFSLNETAVFRKLKFTATEIEESYGDLFIEPSAGKVFVGIKFTIENISNEDQTISSLSHFEAYVDGVKCSESFKGAVAFNGEQLDGTIAPGKKLIGWYPMEVPENWSTIELDVQSSITSISSAKFVFSH